MQSTNYRLKTKLTKGGHKSRVETRGAVSKRKCSGNHRLSTGHSSSCTASWAQYLSPVWTSNTSTLHGRKGYWNRQACLMGHTEPVMSLPLSNFPVACLTPYIFPLPFFLSGNKKLVCCFWLKGGNQLGSPMETSRTFFSFCFLGFSLGFFSVCWFDFCQISWLYCEKALNFLWSSGTHKSIIRRIIQKSGIWRNIWYTKLLCYAVSFSMSHLAAFLSSCFMMTWHKKFKDDSALPIARLSAMPQLHHLLEERTENPGRWPKTGPKGKWILLLHLGWI